MAGRNRNVLRIRNKEYRDHGPGYRVTYYDGEGLVNTEIGVMGQEIDGHFVLVYNKMAVRRGVEKDFFGVSDKSDGDIALRLYDFAKKVAQRESERRGGTKIEDLVEKEGLQPQSS